MYLKITALILAFVGVTMFAVITACRRKDDRITIGDIAYDNNSKKPYVYINEGGNYVPFLVLTDKYQKGSSLLLRKEILDKKYRFNEYSSFYKDSEVDVFLNSDYYMLLEDIHDKIKNTKISVIDNESIGKSGSNLEQIERNVFLLSCKELGFDTSVNAGEEGKVLKYFKNPKNRIVYLNDKADAWILRTPNTYFLSTVYGIGADGVLDLVNAYDKSGIRPAFCVESSTVISWKEGVVDGTKVYVLE